MTRPDSVTARNADAKFAPHEEGQFAGQCVDCIDLGEKVEDFAGTPKKLAAKCALVFRTGEKNKDSGEFIDIAREFTVSMGELSNLRKFLQAWRGKTYTPEQIAEGVPLDKLVSNWALLSIEQKTSGKGRVYANIVTATPVPKMMRPNLQPFEGYERAEYWTDRRKEYADGARAFRAENGVNADGEPEPADTEDFADDGVDDSQLPF